MANNKSRKYVVWIAVAAFVSLFLFLSFKPKSILVEAKQVIQNTFRLTLKNEGRIRAIERHTVYSPAEGDISRINLRSGDQVKKGQILGSLIGDMSWSLKSPINGVIGKVFRESSGPIHRGEPVLEVLNLSELEVVVEALTPDAVQIPVGAPVIVSGWGGEPMPAKVKQVKKVAFNKTSALGVEEQRTEIIIEVVPEKLEEFRKLGDNFHVECEILAFEQKDSMVIPVGALFRDGESWAVYIIENGRARKRKIEYSHRSYTELLITNGLNIGEQVVVYPPDSIQDGVKVKIK